ncbi:MAG: PIG-L family deacetylase [Pyrinomonadaceae bacterium]
MSEIACLFLLALFILAPWREATAQVRAVYDQGAVGLGQLLKRLNNTKTVMHIGAHPDDEDSDLLAYLARAENARTVYLSLTRGDGGQNVIGPELFESLGVIRSEELLQARRLDGGEQLFSRAFDYGFSKRLDEAKAFWDEKIILCDAVRAIRAVRPLVVISRFSGTPADGHGQHQFAGYIAPLAVKAAADPAQCKESGPPWQVLKFYVSQGFRDQRAPTLQVNTGHYDFLLGRSYYEIAAEGRSQHKTQDQGGLELKGDRYSGMNLIESKVPRVENEKSVFDGIDTTIKSNIENKDVTKIREAAAQALKLYDPNNSQKTLSVLLEGYKESEKVLEPVFFAASGRDGIRKGLTDLGLFWFNFSQKKWEFTEAIRLASGLQVDALAGQETAAPGEEFLTSVKVFYPENANIKIKEIKLNAPEGWQIASGEEPQSNSPFARFFRETARDAKFFNVKVSADAKPTEPYFLEKPRRGYLYQWPDDENQNLPFQAPLMSAEITAEIEGTDVTFTQPVEYRYADDTRGEVRRDLNVVPKISLKLDQDLLVFPQSEKAQTRKLILSVTNNSSGPTGGRAKLDLPGNWRATPASAEFDLKSKGDKASVAFEVTVPADYKIGDFVIGAEVEAGGQTFKKTMHEIAYPHIQTHRFYTESRAKAEVIDLKVADVRVGYIMGPGDAVPEGIRQMGLSVEMLGESDLNSGDLSRFDVIVAGIRASEVRPDWVANNQRLKDFMERGGTLIVQYQRGNYAAANLPPYPTQIGPRVSEEDARITILEPTHPVFNFPNKIAEKDWENWVQERNLYSFTNFDPRYTALLEAHDTGEAENKGGLVYAEIGKGKYVYCSYAFFRQLPAGVPGAYRLFANLLSLPGKSLKVKR